MLWFRSTQTLALITSVGLVCSQPGCITIIDDPVADAGTSAPGDGDSGDGDGDSKPPR
jgi:hypothetical protein